jgi:hypothetical protein
MTTGAKRGLMSRLEDANLLKEKEGYAALLIQITSISNLGDARA